jgi:hypothetical protein
MLLMVAAPVAISMDSYATKWEEEETIAAQKQALKDGEKAIEAQVALDLIRARTEWYRSHTNAEEPFDNHR